MARHDKRLAAVAVFFGLLALQPKPNKKTKYKFYP
jgi:hypothetical protein